MLKDFIDRFNVGPKASSIAAAFPKDRKKLLRYIKNYLEECEKADNATPNFRRRVNR